MVVAFKRLLLVFGLTHFGLSVQLSFHQWSMLSKLSAAHVILHYRRHKRCHLPFVSHPFSSGFSMLVCVRVNTHELFFQYVERLEAVASRLEAIATY